MVEQASKISRFLSCFVLCMGVLAVFSYLKLDDRYVVSSLLQLFCNLIGTLLGIIFENYIQNKLPKIGKKQVALIVILAVLIVFLCFAQLSNPMCDAILSFISVYFFMTYLFTRLAKRLVGCK